MTSYKGYNSLVIIFFSLHTAIISDEMCRVLLLFLVITLLAAIAAAAAPLAPEAASRPVAVAASAAAPAVGRPLRHGVNIRSIFEIFITEA
jgi:hypothetical protein